LHSLLTGEFPRRSTPQETTKCFNRHFLSMVAAPIKRGAVALHILPQQSGHQSATRPTLLKSGVHPVTSQLLPACSALADN
jgi:hypothetical protein